MEIRLVKRSIAVILLFCFLLILSFPGKSYALGSTFTTVNSNGTPVWSKASSKSTKIRTLKKGVNVTIVSTTINDAGNKWGKTVNNTWIFMENLKSTNVSAGEAGSYVAKKDDTPLRNSAASSSTIIAKMKKGESIEIIETYFNDVGNAWGTGTYNKKTYTVFLDNLEKSDECECEWYEILKTAIDLPFVTRKDNVPIWSSPTKDSTQVGTITKKGTRVYVIGRVRNKYDNLWLQTEEGNFIFVDNVAFSLDDQFLIAAQQTLALPEYAPFEFFNNVKPGGNWDFKQDNLLGLNTNDYYVFINGKVQNDRMTGEEIGNVFYGFMGRVAGFTEKILTDASGGVNIYIKYKNSTLTYDDLKNCFKGRCESPEDKANVLRGIRYFDLGKWE